MTNDDYKRIFSTNLRRLLDEKNSTQKELADALGISPQLVNTWTTGKHIPRMSMIEAISRFFGISKSELIEQERTTENAEVVLTDKEKELIKVFRVADDGIQKSVLILLGLN